MRLFESTQNMVKMQESCLELLLQKGQPRHHGFLLSEFERDNFNKLPRKMPIQMANGDESTPTVPAGEGGAGGSSSSGSVGSFVLYNSLAQKRLEVVTLRVQHPNVKIVNDKGVELNHIQINPVWNITDTYEQGLGTSVSGTVGRIRTSTRQFEVMFVAELEPLSLSTYRVQVDEVNFKRNIATIYCDDCTESQPASVSPPEEMESSPTSVFEARGKPAGEFFTK